ncbi:MAG: hypothetical protein ABIO85_10285 [Sphingomicrobium sp.]
MLYSAIIADMRDGGGYYESAAIELRRGHYPLRPFITFRLPTLAWLSTELGKRALSIAQWLLAIGVLILWRRQLKFMPLGVTGAALILTLLGLSGLVEPSVGLFAESWAAMLLAAAIAIDRPGTRLLALAAGLAALLFRELALPAILSFGLVAGLQRRWREAAGWGLVITMFLIAVFFHARAVAAVVMATDLASPGWSSFAGPGFAISCMVLATPLSLMPAKLGAAALAMSLFGWLSLDELWAIAALMVLTITLAMLAIMARPDTYYWALMAAPLSLTGLAFVPAALGDLARSLRGVSVRVQ